MGTPTLFGIVGRNTFIAYGLAPSSGANTVTITLSVSATISYAIDEFTGTHATVPLHVAAASTGTSNTPSVNVFSSVADVMFVGVMTHSNDTAPITPVFDHTQIGEWETNSIANDSDSAYNALYRVVTGFGSFTTSWTTAFVSWTVLVIAFKPPTPITPERTAVGKSASVLWKIRNTIGSSAMILWTVEVLEWPDIPVPLRSHRRSADLQNLTTEMETGHLRKRRQFEDHRELWEVGWNFTEDKFETFKTFFDVTLKNGSVRFHIELFGLDRIAEFFEPYNLSRSDNLYSVGATLLVHRFSPLQIGSLMIWLDGQSITSIDAAAVSSWQDQSGKGNHATQETADNRPTIRKRVLNNKSVVRFDGTNDFLILPNTLAALTEGEMFIVLKAVNDPGTDFVSSPWHFGTNPSTFYPYSDGIIYDDFGTTTRKTTVNPSLNLSSFRLYNVNSKSGEWTSRLNGTQLFTTEVNTVAFPTNPALGTGNNGTGQLFSGDIAEVIVFGRSLTSIERGYVQDYLNTKYNLF